MSTRFTTGTVIDSVWLNQVDDLLTNTDGVGPDWTEDSPNSYSTSDDITLNGVLTTTDTIYPAAIDTDGFSQFAGAEFSDGIIENAATVAALDIVPNTASYFYKTISAPSTFTFTPSDTGAGWVFSFTLEVTNSGGAQTITWPASVKWPSGVKPTETTGIDVYTFWSRDNGTIWYGSLVGNYTA